MENEQLKSTVQTVLKELGISKPKEQPPFKSELRLIFQGSIPIVDIEAGMGWYNELKIWLLAISPNVTVNGQIMKPLEPCCKEKPVKAVETELYQKGVPPHEHVTKIS